MFPHPIPIPETVVEARRLRVQQLLAGVSQGLLLRFCIATTEIGAFFLLASQTLLMDGLSTLFDMMGSLALIISLRWAARPPDETHPFGHGRLEPLVGFQFAMIMALSGLFFVGYEGLNFFNEERSAPISWMAPLISCTSTLLLVSAFCLLNRKAKKHHSPVVAMEARHFLLDAMNSGLATLMLILGQIDPSMSLFFDRIGALMLAALMTLLGIRTIRETIGQLLDQAPDGVYFERVKKAALRVEGVLETEKTKIQIFGPNAHVSIDIEVDPTLRVDEAHLISQKVRSEIQKELPEVEDVLVHIEPYYPGDHR